MNRLGLVLDQILYEKDGHWSTDEAFIRFVELAVSPAFDRIQFCSRVRASEEEAPYVLDPATFDIVPLPWYSDIQALCLRSPLLIPRIASILARVMSGWNLAIASGVHPLTPLVLRMARRRNIPAVFWVRGNLEADLSHRVPGLRRHLALAVARLLLRSIPRGTPVVSVGRSDYPFLARLGPVHVVYSSKFDETDFRPLPRPAPHDDPCPRLLYVGRLSPEKGLETLLEAVHRLGSVRGCHPGLTLVGDDYYGGTYGKAFQHLVERMALPGEVKMVGHIPYGPRLFECYDSHDLLVLPSYTEGFPQVILEAMARGLPVVSTSVGGIPRVIEHEQTGLLVPPGDPQSLADAIRKVLLNKEFAQSLALRGQRSIRPFARREQAQSLLHFLSRCFPRSFQNQGPVGP